MCTSTAFYTKVHLVDCLVSFDDAPTRPPKRHGKEIGESAQQILFGLSLLADPAFFVTLQFGLITDDGNRSLCSTLPRPARAITCLSFFLYGRVSRSHANEDWSDVEKSL